jgi:hypothetical protein
MQVPGSPIFERKRRICCFGHNHVSRTCPTLNDLLLLQVVDVKGCFLWWRGEPALDALLQSGHQDIIAELLHFPWTAPNRVIIGAHRLGTR